jgi:DNA polymerase-3 subunit alpha
LLNKNGLVFPFLLGITNVDPIKAEIGHTIRNDPEFPDIDVDLLPSARSPIKDYAEKKYGSEFVCNIGLWLTYKAKLAIQDAASVLGHNRSGAIDVCRDLPEEIDGMTASEALAEFEPLKEYADEKPEVIDLAFKMMGKIKSPGKHAGGLIISSVPIRDYVPLMLTGSGKKKHWVTAWTEGMAASQLSKLGMVKFDLLGLLNLSYIYNCKRLIRKNQGIEIDFEDINPEDNRMGWVIHPNGKRKKILINDPKALKMADKVKVESVFQFDTNCQKGILEKGGVKRFMDLLIYNSLGRPGPLPMVDVYIQQRDDPDKAWRDELHPKMLNILEETEGILTFQEQLLRIWVEVCGFTMPEAEAAQKAVKKKREGLLREIKPRVIEGGAPVIGEAAAKDLWDKMVSFGRYCFNKSHALGYTIVAYRCLWLKTYFPAEWWAATLSECPPHKTAAFMGAARSEGLEFGPINVNSLTTGFTVDGNKVTPGALSIKGIGDAVAETLVSESAKGPFDGLDDFVLRCKKNKTACERLIKLGGFDSFDENRRALWAWYLYKYDNDTQLKRRLNNCYSWSMADIAAERDRQLMEYQRLYPRRKKIPTKILNWVPKTPCENPKPYDSEKILTDDEIKACKKIVLEFKHIEKLFPKTYSLANILEFEKKYLGYYWNSPVDIFVHGTNSTIEDAKQTGILECVVEECITKEGARGEYLILFVTDGINTARVNVWGNEIMGNDEEVFQIGAGIRIPVNWQDKWRSFAVKRNMRITQLPLKEEE